MLKGIGFKSGLLPCTLETPREIWLSHPPSPVWFTAGPALTILLKDKQLLLHDYLKHHTYMFRPDKFTVAAFVFNILPYKLCLFQHAHVTRVHQHSPAFNCMCVICKQGMLMVWTMLHSSGIWQWWWGGSLSSCSGKGWWSCVDAGPFAERWRIGFNQQGWLMMLDALVRVQLAKLLMMLWTRLLLRNLT